MERLAEILEKTLVSEIIQTSEEQIETLNVLINAQKDSYYEKEVEACEETIKKVRAFLHAYFLLAFLITVKMTIFVAW